MTQLSLLSGKVSNLKTQKGYKNFISSSAGRAATQAGAIGAATSGAFFNSGVLTTASMIREGVTYYTCKINGTTVTGYLNIVAFKNTDEVEFVVEYDRNDRTQALAYAVRKPNEHKLWIMDRAESGENVMKEFFWRFPLILVPIFILLGVLLKVSVSCFNDCSRLLSVNYLLHASCHLVLVGYLFICLWLWVSIFLSCPKLKLRTKLLQHWVMKTRKKSVLHK